jgi:hypothetical protein
MRRAAATVLTTTLLGLGLGGPAAGVAAATVGADQTVQYPGTVAPGGEVRNNRPTVRDNQPAAAPVARTTRPRVADSRQTLPFTGGELVALVAVGAGAVGAGAALVVATRRRSPQSA